MAQKKKLQVFVSSTYEDLREERQAAVEAILTAGHIPAGMELFAAGDQSQMDAIKRWIDESDAFLLILGRRYGSIDPVTKKSYVHLEYEYAQDTGGRGGVSLMVSRWKKALSEMPASDLPREVLHRLFQLGAGHAPPGPGASSASSTAQIS
jgi:hypothetical protein